MRVILAYVIAAALILAFAIFAVMPVTTTLIREWSRRDVELRSTSMVQFVRGELDELLARGDAGGVQSLFERLALDERLLAVGFCNADGTLRYRSGLMPAAFTCEKVARADSASFSTLDFDRRMLLIGSYPIAESGARGHLVLLHDLTFARQRSAQAQMWVMIALIAIALMGIVFAGIAALLIGRRWLTSIRQMVDDARMGRAGSEASYPSPVFGKELANLLRDLNDGRRSVEAAYVDWTPQTLQTITADQLPDAQILVVSNREPYIHNRGKSGITLQIPASGLVAAVEPVVRACGGTWVAHGSGSADRDVVDAHDRIGVPPSAPTYTLRRVWLSDEEQDGYYYGLANEGLWPLCHVAFVRPIFREGDWEQYRAVNARFARAVADEASRPDPIILVQDYHFALLPKMIRELLPRATIITFWHIPWPNSETFSICPWKSEILEGLLGSTVLGFHTQFYCNNFIETVDRFVESRIDRETASVTMGGHETFVRPYPISIEWPPAALEGQASVPECRATIRAQLGLADEVKLGVGIERFDYTKGILDRMHAVDQLLSNHPEWRGRFVFLQIAAPTRDKLARYRELQDQARALADEINARHGIGGCDPIRLVIEHREPGEVFELFRAADICIVSSLHDGMNLVAKEFVAARDDERGVLILSTFAGASRELSEALIVNPYDAHSMGEALDRALRMPDIEQRERMRLLRDVVREKNVYRWAGRMLLDAAQLRKHQKLLHMVATDRAASETIGLRGAAAFRGPRPERQSPRASRA